MFEMHSLLPDFSLPDPILGTVNDERRYDIKQWESNIACGTKMYCLKPPCLHYMLQPKTIMSHKLLNIGQEVHRFRHKKVLQAGSHAAEKLRKDRTVEGPKNALAISKAKICEFERTHSYFLFKPSKQSLRTLLLRATLINATSKNHKSRLLLYISIQFMNAPLPTSYLSGEIKINSHC